MNRPHNYHHMYELCRQHIHSYVLAQINDGTKVDGIITGLDDENVYLAVPNFGHAREERILPYGYPVYGPGIGYPGYGYGPYPYRPSPFRRLILPLTALTAISALPWY